MTNTTIEQTEDLGFRQVNRSAYAHEVAARTAIYLGVCTEHDRPVRFDAGAEDGHAKRLIPCPESGHLIEGERLVAVTTTLVCDGACMGAYRPTCMCGCGGVNHGSRFEKKIGTGQMLESAITKFRVRQEKVRADREVKQQTRERKAKVTFDEWAEENDELVRSLRAHAELEDANSFLTDLAAQVSGGRYGEGSKALSDGQASAAIRVLGQFEARVLELAARKAAAKPCPTGKIEISGEIVKVIVKEGYSCNSDDYKAIVKCDGYVVYVTLPKALDTYASQEQLFWKLRESGEFTAPDARTRGADYYAMTENCTRVFKGFKISFTATVTRSERDESFGFAKRPTKVTFTPPTSE